MKQLPDILTSTTFWASIANLGAGCPISRVVCEKWGFAPTPSNPHLVLRRFLLLSTDEHGREPGLVVSCRSKAPLLATNARNGAPKHPQHPSLILRRSGAQRAPRLIFPTHQVQSLTRTNPASP